MKKLAIMVVIVAIVAFGTVSPVTSLTSVSRSSTVQRLKIMDYITFVAEGNVTYFTVKGVIKNNSTTNVRSVNVTAVFYDADNNLIATRVSSTALKIIRPEQKTPFEVYLLLVSFSSPDHCHLTALGIETDQEPIGKFKIVNQTSKVEGGYRVILGELKNEGSMRAVSVKVICVCYDSQGNLTAMSHTYPNPVTLDPDENASFKIRLKLAPGIELKRFELFVSARSYEKVAEARWILLSALAAAAVLYIVYMKRRGW